MFVRELEMSYWRNSLLLLFFPNQISTLVAIGLNLICLYNCQKMKKRSKAPAYNFLGRSGKAIILIIFFFFVMNKHQLINKTEQ